MFEQAVLLAAVKLGTEAYGRGILRAVQEGLQREIAAGAVYATLDRLEQKSLLSSRLEADGSAVRGGRARRYYRVTAGGVRALNESKQALERLWSASRWPLGWQP